MTFLKLFGKKKEAKKFEFPSKVALETPPRPPVTEVEELPEVPEPEEELPTPPSVEEYEIHETEHEVASGPVEGPFEPRKEVHREDVIEVSKRKPIYVKVGLYKNLINEISSSGTTLKESESSLTRLSHVKIEEDSEFEKWRKQMLDIQRKLIFVDKTLFE